MVSSADLRQVLDAVASELVQAFDLAHATIALLDPHAAEHDHLLVVAEGSSPSAPDGALTPLPDVGADLRVRPDGVRPDGMPSDVRGGPACPPSNSNPELHHPHPG